MKINSILLTLLVVMMVFPISQSFAQLEGVVLERVDVGNSALDVKILDGQAYVTNPEDGTISVIDGKTHEIVRTIQVGKGIGAIEIVEDKNKIYATFLQNSKVHVFDLESGEKLKEIDIGEANVTMYSKSDKPYGQREYVTFDTDAVGLAYNPNTEILYAVHTTVNHINYIDTKTDTNLGDIVVGKTPLLIIIDEQRDIGYVTNRESNDVSVLDLKLNKEIKKLATGFVPFQPAIDNANNRLYITHHASPQVTAIDLRDQTIETKIALKAPTHALAVDTKRNILHVTYMPDSGFTGVSSIGMVEFIDTKTNKLVKSMDLQFNPFTIIIDPDNDKLFSTNIVDGSVGIVDLTAEKTILGMEQKETTEETEPSGGGCLIATAAYGTELAPQVQLLREIRDNTLFSTAFGTSFMSGFNTLYYSFAPTIADWERESPMFKETIKTLITPMLSTLSIMSLADEGSEVDVLGLGISVIALNLGMYIAAPAVVAWQIKKRI
jgi:YVTN family beta-propeller protein